ncbi:heterokaryon incompatibility protein-domain-containing protein [Rhexocercosporidium sp. MPI-PUGE-AT-0058]|nr:heterokaryon incompatibility protein-domain-containing protein [Rhexocercosporidium sp. MPI-PUGE-AT-0058]
MATSSSDLYDLLPVGSREIRLLQAISLETDRTLWSLEVASLDSNAQFVALSYVWGKPSQTESISVNGQAIAITVNLAHALHHSLNVWATIHQDINVLRLRIWADAICINQADLLERSNQVRMMGSIYSSAKFVLSWLGLEPSNWNYLGWGMDTFATLAHEVDGLSVDELLKFDWIQRHPWLCWDHEDLGRTGNTRWNGTIELMEEDYWKRLWIYQELVLPKDVYLFTTSRHLHLDKLLCLSQQLRALRTAVLKTKTPRPSFLHDSIWLNLFGANSPDIWAPLNWVSQGRRNFHQDGNVPRATGGPNNDQWDLAFMIARKLESTEPKDLIYGLLGVLNLDVAPDYSLATSAADVYCDFIRAYLDHCHRLQQPESLTFLTYSGVGMPASTASDSFPSWCPRFFAPTSHGLATHGDATFAAGVGIFSSDKPSATVQGQQLHTLGVGVDTIISVDEMELKLHSDEDDARIFDELKKVFCQMTPTFGSLTGTNPIVAVYRLLASIHPVAHFVPERRGNDGIFFLRLETLLDALRALDVNALRAASNPEYDAESKHSYISADYGDPDRLPLHMENPGRYVEYVVGSVVREYQDSPSILSAMISVIEVVHRQAKHSIFRISKDYLGIAPQGCVENDRVCILQGSKYPVVLRKEGDQYVLIGTCIVPGLMDGEAIGLAKSGRGDNMQRFAIR